MLCNICDAIKNKKIVVQKIEKDFSLSGYKIHQITQNPNEPIPDKYKLYWDGTVEGFEFVLNNCDCNARN
jgi:hypothetical protein